MRIVRASGVVVTRAKPVARQPAAARRRAGKARAAATAATEQQALLQALAAQELKPVDELAIARSRPTGRRGASKAGRAASVDVAVDVGPDESAVVLVEQDGEYSWHFPRPASASAASATRRRGAARPARKAGHVTIPIRLAPPRRATGGEARARRSAAGPRAALVGKARAYVLKFVAGQAVGVAMKFLERNVRKGLIVMDGDDPAAWRRISHIDDLGLAAKPKLRVLLWVHGTFSSTAGSFGALTATPDGLYLLRQARERYDAVLGFDHATLSETPYENAVDLVERLGRFERPMEIDAVTYSRGGLVFRSLVEQILPTSEQRADIGQAVFVGVPNHGTLLAEPDNWKTLVDVHTNLSMGALRLLERLPMAAPSAFLLSEIVSGLGAFVKYLAVAATDESVVPGLAAQRPSGRFVRTLNETGDGQPLPDDCRYLAITSSFDARAAMKKGDEATGLAGSFLGKLADGFVDELTGTKNDLVVHTSSMKKIDPDAGEYIDASLDFADSPVVYHTVYFAQPAVALQLRGWLMDDTAREGLRERRGLVSVRPSPRAPFTRVRYHEVDGRRPAERASTARAAGRRRAKRKSRRRVELPAIPSSAENRRRQKAAAAHLTKLFGIRSAPSPIETAPKTAAAASGRRRGARKGDARAAKTAADAPRARAYAPALEPRLVQSSPITTDEQLKVVSFQQMHRSIPIFGSRATVEMDDANNMIAARAKLGRVDGVSPKPAMSAKAAFEKLSELAAFDKAAVDVAKKAMADEPPSLTFFYNRPESRWHLAYLFSDLPGMPGQQGLAANGKRTANKRVRGHGASSPRARHARSDYLVDANDGRLVYRYRVAPAAAKPKKLPVISVAGLGIDDDGVAQKLVVCEVKGGFELHDPVRKIRTYDFDGGDVDTALPPKIAIRVTDATANFKDACAPGVSAHVNSSIVFKFYNDVLIRRGVDDQGSYLHNIVNCVSSGDEDPPYWANATWWKDKMWYGRIRRKGGGFRSFAALLDIIGHELTHGVTEHTCNLVYRDEHGALDESFSDIFGVMIKNYARGPQVYSNPDKWDWEIGSGLGEKGGPLRSMKKPGLTGDPAHTGEMGNYDPKELEEDDGGVHTFSSIHNKAAYNLLTTRTGKKGSKTPLVFTPDEVAQAYYFTLQRLDRMPRFEDVYETLIDVVKSVYRVPADQARRCKAVAAAYAAVGIPRA